MTSNESEDRPTLEPPTPAELLSELVSKIKKQDASIGLPGFLANAYLDWSYSLVVAGGTTEGKRRFRISRGRFLAFSAHNLETRTLKYPHQKKNWSSLK